MATAKRSIAVRGAGVVGLWQALTLAKAGHDVTVYERSQRPFEDGCSIYAGAMLAPRCEEEGAEAVIRELGMRAIALWRDTYPRTIANGSLVVAQERDRVLLDRFARMTTGHRKLDGKALAEIEPDLADRAGDALFYPDEAHVAPVPALNFLLEAAQANGARLELGSSDVTAPADIVIDCRGLAARGELAGLRGVRGERLVVRASDVALSRPVRLLHPRFPLYTVPWGDGLYMLGATVIESDEAGPISVRSALELLSAACALDPAFSEAVVIAQGAGVRPAFPDNVPRIMTSSGYIYVNGLYRHGFLLAPALAELVAEFVATGAKESEVFCAGPGQR